MACKDAYEVARLYTNGQFVDKLKQQFKGDFTLRFNLAPPLLAKKDANGYLVKTEYGSWMWKAFGVLTKLKTLRGTWLDVFGYTAERRMKRALIEEYRSTILSLLDGLNKDNLVLAVQIAALPEKILGFGHVKEKAVQQYRDERKVLLGKSEASLHGMPHAA